MGGLRRPRGPQRVVTLAGVLLVASCGDGQPTLFSAPAEVRFLGSADATVEVGEALVPAPAFQVLDDRGNPVPGLTVTLRVEAGAGSVFPTEGVTDEAGQVQLTYWRMGQGVGSNALVAEVDGVEPARVQVQSEPGPPAMIVPVSSAQQVGTVATPVPEPPLARLTDRFENPLEGFQLSFEPEDDSGEIDGASVLLTDAQGQAGLASWTLGTRSGTQAVQVTLVGGTGGPPGLRFVAQALPGPAADMAAAAPQDQTAEAVSDVPEPPAVRFVDAYDNPVPGVMAAFQVEEGDGSVEGAPAVSGADGVARLARWTLGSEVGPNRVVATAGSFPAVEFRADATLITTVFTIEAVHLNQGSQTLNGDIGGVARRAGLLRVVARANRENSESVDALVRLYDGGVPFREVRVAGPPAVPTDPDPNRLSDTWDLHLPPEDVPAGLEVEVILDPDSAAAVSSRDGHHFPPGGGSVPLDVQPLAPFQMVFFPVTLTRENEITGFIDRSNVGDFLAETRRWIPLHLVQWTIRSPWISDVDLRTSEGWADLLSGLRAGRIADGTTYEYYHGIVPFFSGIAWAGFAYVAGDPENRSLRVGVTYDVLPAASGTLAHELGHNLGRRHSPCGGPDGVDQDYPYPNATLGTPGYDIFRLTLVNPDDNRDYMSYCGPRFASDYTYGATLTRRRTDPVPQGGGTGGIASSGPEAGSSGGALDRAPTAAASHGLLIWGRVGSSGAVLNPAFRLEAPPSLPREGGPHTLRGLAADGRELFRLSFEGDRPDHTLDPRERHFGVFVPLSPAEANALERIELDSPLGRAVQVTAPVRLPHVPEPELRDPEVTLDPLGDGRVRLRWNGERFPMAMLRDPATGLVVGFARDGSMVLPGGRGEALDVILSDGVRSGPARQR
jgi:hypothetical protein